MMIGLIILLMVLILALLVSIRMNVTSITWDGKQRDVNHAHCMSHVAHYVGNHFAAEVLKAAAEDYNSPEAQHEIGLIAREQWVQDGPNVPSIWMSNRAEDLIAEVDDPWGLDEFNLSGERA